MSWRLIRWPNNDTILKQAENMKQHYARRGMNVSLRKCIEEVIKQKRGGGFGL